MAQTVIECLELLSAGELVLNKIDELESEESRLEQVQKKLEKDLEQNQKKLVEETKSTVKSRLDGIDEGFRKEIDKLEDQLKKSKAKREKAKTLGMKERIQEETEDLRVTNKGLKKDIKVMFKQNHVPGFCNSFWFYSLFMPKTLLEFTILLITVSVIFLALPYGIYYVFHLEHVLYLSLLYASFLIVFGGIYIMMGNKLRVRHEKILLQGRRLRNNILENRKMIKKIIKRIYKDKDDSSYNLSRFDDEISRLELQIKDANQKKLDAVHTFETVTSGLIADEIEQLRMPKILELETQLKENQELFVKTSFELKEYHLRLTEQFAVYLGKDFITLDKIAALKTILYDKRATSIEEAMDVYQKDQLEHPY